MISFFASLTLLLSSYANAILTDAAPVPCRSLVEIEITSKTNARVLKSRVDIRSADKNGKGIFHIDVQRQENALYTIIQPEQVIHLPEVLDLTVHFSEGESIKLRDASISDNMIVCNIAKDLRPILSDNTIVSLSFDGLYESYDILFKPQEMIYYNDLISCMSSYR